MNLNHNNLTIHVGDEVTFYAFLKEFNDVKFTGIVKGTIKCEELTLLIDVDDFTTCTVPASEIIRVNNLFINLNNFNKSLSIGA